jgi:hypothetical protein
VQSKRAKAEQLGQRALWGRGRLATDEDQARVFALKGEGKSIRKIAAETGVSRSVVQRLLAAAALVALFSSAVELGDDYERFALWDLVPPELRGILLNLTWNNAELWTPPLGARRWSLNVCFSTPTSTVASASRRSKSFIACTRWPVKLTKKPRRSQTY